MNRNTWVLAVVETSVSPGRLSLTMVGAKADER